MEGRLRRYYRLSDEGREAVVREADRLAAAARVVQRPRPSRGAEHGMNRAAAERRAHVPRRPDVPAVAPGRWPRGARLRTRCDRAPTGTARDGARVAVAGGRRAEGPPRRRPRRRAAARRGGPRSPRSPCRSPQRSCACGRSDSCPRYDHWPLGEGWVMLLGGSLVAVVGAALRSRWLTAAGAGAVFVAAAAPYLGFGTEVALHDTPSFFAGQRRGHRSRVAPSDTAPGRRSTRPFRASRERSVRVVLDRARAGTAADGGRSDPPAPPRRSQSHSSFSLPGSGRGADGAPKAIRIRSRGSPSRGH